MGLCSGGLGNSQGGERGCFPVEGRGGGARLPDRGLVVARCVLRGVGGP